MWCKALEYFIQYINKPDDDTVLERNENYSVCKNIVEKENNSIYSELNNLSALYSRKQKVAEDLCVDIDDINPLHLDENKTIKLGDLVKKY